VFGNCTRLERPKLGPYVSVSCHVSNVMIKKTHFHLRLTDGRLADDDWRALRAIFFLTRVPPIPSDSMV